MRMASWREWCMPSLEPWLTEDFGPRMYIQIARLRGSSGQPFLERADRRGRESHRRDEPGDVRVLGADHRARHVRTALLEPGEQRVGEAATDAALARGGFDAEELEPAGRLL